MYLAPLNYDRFFKKVFSHTHIAKAFLEDFLDVTIEEITLLDRSKFLTDESARVEVDFRCKIKGSYIVIDMQQWYKPDVVRRFYLYHCASTVLQLENLPEKRIEVKTNTPKAKGKNYKELEPVLTLVWMVDDDLQFSEHFVAYTTAPETAIDFLENHKLWEKEDITELKTIRERILKTLENKHKNLDFLRKNRLIFMFQENIVKEEKFSKYHDWFEFAEKTRNKSNKKNDFQKFQGKDIFKEMMRLIAKNNLDKEELTYISTEAEDLIMFKRFLDDEREYIYDEAMEAGLKKGMEKGIEKGIEKSVISLHKKGKTAEDISEWLEIPLEKVQSILQNAKKEGLL